MALDPLLARLIRRAYAAGHGQLPHMTTEQVRAHCAKLVPPVNRPIPFEDYAPKSGVHFRIHRSRTLSAGTLFYFRGSAFTGGGLLDETNDYCDTLAQRFHCDVINCGFRVAPTYKFPTFYDDCVHTVEWLAQHTKNLNFQRPYILWGESSGGTKAAALSQHFAKRDLFDQLVLAYPMVNLVHDTPSKQAYGQGYLLDLTMIEWLKARAMNSPIEAYDYRLSPGLGDTLPNIPTLIITAEYDPLRDEAELYAQRLKGRGIPVHLLRKSSMIHGFLRYYKQLKAARETFDWIEKHLSLKVVCD